MENPQQRDNGMNTSTSRADGFLGWIERSGNKLPDPVFIFVYCILGVIAASVIATFFGVSAAHPCQSTPTATH